MYTQQLPCAPDTRNSWWAVMALVLLRCINEKAVPVRTVAVLWEIAELLQNTLWCMEERNGLHVSLQGAKMFRSGWTSVMVLVWDSYRELLRQPGEVSAADNKQARSPINGADRLFSSLFLAPVCIVHLIFCKHSSCGRCQVDVVGHNAVKEPGKKNQPSLCRKC